MRATLVSVILACLMAATLPPATGAQKFEADLVIVNAIVHTMDAHHPTAEAVAVFANRVAAVGSNDEIKSLIGARTRVIDAKGAPAASSAGHTFEFTPTVDKPNTVSANAAPVQSWLA